MKIYLAHSKKDYGNVYEKEIIEQIKEIFGSEHEYINPANSEKCLELEEFVTLQPTKYGKFLAEMEYFFNIIKNCDMLIAFPYSKSGNYTSGVKKEIEYAYDINIKVEHIDEFCINKDDYISIIKDRTPKCIGNIECRTVTSTDILSIGVKLLGKELLLRIDSSCSQIFYCINGVKDKLFTCDIFDIVLHDTNEINKFIKILELLRNVESQGDGGDGGYTNFPLSDLSNLNCSFFIDYGLMCKSKYNNLTIVTKGTSEPTSLWSCIYFAALESKKQFLEKKIFADWMVKPRAKNQDKLIDEYISIRHKILDYDLNEELQYV